MDKYLILSHDADIDGMGPIILAKLAKNHGNIASVNYNLVNYKNIDEVIKNLISWGDLRDYDKILITDVCPSRETLSQIDSNPELRDKVAVIDHHKPSLDKRDFGFVDVKEEVNGVKTSATELFYFYMMQQGLISPDPSLLDFVELTRISDVWEQSSPYFGKADDLAELFNVIGSQRYIESMENHLDQDKENFDFDQDELQIIAARRKEIADACEKAYKTMRIKEVDGIKVAVCDIKYSFRNNFSQYLRDKKVDADIMAIADLGRGTMSYRSLSAKGDCNAFAQRFGGGGHTASAGSPITEEVEELLGIEVNKK